MPAGLEQLDAYGTLETLPFSLDDPNWDLLFPAEIPDQCSTFTLEQLDNFGNMETLPYSLDDPFWQQIICIKFGQGVAYGAGFVDASANATFSASADVTGAASVAANANRIASASGSITSNASVNATGNAIFASSGSIGATATVSAIGHAIRYAQGSVYAYASVSAYGNAVWSASGEVNSSADVNATGIRYRLSSGSIDANASVSGSADRIRTSTANVSAEAGVTALGGVEYSGSGDVLATATLTTIANAIFSAHGSVSSSASISVDGIKLGDNWLPPVVVPPDNYTPVTPPVDEWGLVAPAIGERFQGGYYAGEYVLNGVTYYIILGDKANEIRASGVTGALYGVANYQLYVSENDGLFNTNWIAQIGKTKPNTNSEYYKIRQKNISGITDWYYPSKNELELIIQNLYPTTTSAPLFKTGGSQALGTSNPTGYWTSSIRSIYNYPAGRSWYLWASETQYGGGMYSPPYGNNVQEYLFYFRPIRKVRK